MASSPNSFPVHTTAQVLLALTSLLIGFKLGSSSWPSSSTELQDEVAEEETMPEPEVAQEEAWPDEELAEEDLEEVADGDLAAIKPKAWEQCKLVLVVRIDLKMKPGDISTQCSNATLACYKALSNKNPKLTRHWEVTGQAKIALKGTSDEQLLELEAIAKSLNLCARVVHNEELTKGKEGTRTVLGIGPAPVDLINEVTGKLRLL